MRVLVAEDDDRIAETLTNALSRAGFAVERESEGESVWFRGDSEAFDAIILDLGLPQMDGLTILKRWRAAGKTTPVLILTARGQWEERVDGIEAGADDYVVKPFHIMEIVARVRSLVRRASGLASSRVPFGRYMLDTGKMQVFLDGAPIDLTPQEYKLVAYLVHQRGRVVSQLEITEHIYNQDYERDSNAVEVLVGRVRKRLGQEVIRTRRGFGYVLGEDA
ncbi:response regulator transcription factor [Devosia sp. RR2S18]|uniref:response regulator transcription factor n=1 Tax=Devosia rhizosphaerae TaxID=3049774 RepID=UPI00254131A3|nr:response regulator transcription factor [Devosia sp. RR2S18]WIJ24130.1 response regulator transcription factor [Devosia sp. RR2S18]